jgi:glycerol-3-phosphate dehydrogenase
VILGTTDTDYSGDRDHPVCDPEDARYILEIANRTFPDVGLTPADIISTFAGLRPLIGGKTGTPSDISRRHQIQMTEPGWFDVAGGKLTTYRLMAEQTIDQIVSHLKCSTPACSTADVPLLDESQPLFSGILPPDVTREAVEHFCAKEWVMHLDDVMIRRTSWQQYVDDPATVAERVSQWMAPALGWDKPRCEDEVKRYRETLKQTYPMAI